MVQAGVSVVVLEVNSRFYMKGASSENVIPAKAGIQALNDTLTAG
jgi:hypothetical protein